MQKEYANRKLAKRSIDSYKKEANIHDACEDGDIELVTQLINQSPSEIWKTDEICYFSALHVAANHGHLEIVKLLLDAGSDINRKSKSGETPLHLAVMKNHVDVVKCLLVRGADYTITNFHKKGTYTIRNTPRDIAVEEHLPEIVKIFDNMKHFEKKKEKELKEEKEWKAEQLKVRTAFEASLLSALQKFKADNKGAADYDDKFVEFQAQQEKEKLDFQQQSQEAIDEFYKNHKTLRPPPKPVTNSATEPGK